MPLVFPEVAAFVAFAAALGAFVLYRTETMWLRPLVLALQHPHGSWWKRLLLKGAAAVAVATLYVEKHVRIALSQFAAGGLHMLTRGFAGLASAFHFTYREIGLVAHDMADAFGHLRWHTMPREINRKVAPVKIAATHAGTVAGRANARVKAEEKARRRSISLTNNRLGAIAAGLLGIDILVRGRNRAHHHADHTRTIPAHGHSIADHGARIKRLEKALGLGIFAALIFRTLARVAPWLFCRNWKVLGRAICGMNPNALNSLIGLLVGVFVFSDLRRSARLAEDALDVVTTVVWDAASIGDRPKGRFTID